MLVCQEFMPHPALRDYINLYSVLEAPLISDAEIVDKNPPVINKGLMFHYRRDDYLIVNNEGFLRGEMPRGFLMAQGVHPNTWKYRGGFGIFAVIFKPGKFRFFYPDPMLEFLDGLITFEDYNERALLEVHERIMLAKTHLERVQLVDQYLLRKARLLNKDVGWLQYALHQLYLQPHLNIRDICQEVDKSSGHFRRTFAREIGISPKSMQLLMRMTHALNLMHTNPRLRLTDIAYQCGFSDQAHFNRTFKKHTDLTPLAFRNSQGRIADFINHHDEIRY